MKDERIITYGKEPTKVRIMNILQTAKMLMDKTEEHPRLTVNASMYVLDVGYLLTIIEDLTHDSKPEKKR